MQPGDEASVHSRGNAQTQRQTHEVSEEGTVNGANGSSGAYTEVASAAGSPRTGSPSLPRLRAPSLKLRLLLAGEAFLDYFVRFIGPLLSILAVFLIGYVTRSYFVEVLPLLNARVCHSATDEALRRYATRGDWVLDTRNGRDGMSDTRTGRFIPGDSSRPHALEQMQEHSRALEHSIELSGCAPTHIVTAFGIYLLCSIIFHYFSCMLKGPGRPPSTPFGEEVLNHLANYDPERRDDQQIRFCKPCNQVKPMRAHHCRVCGKCCLKMDHHCPWVNTCVGWRNLRHFISFLLFLWLGTGFFLLAGFDSAVSVLLGDGGDSAFLIACIIAFAAFIAGSLFLSWTTYLLVTNQSTIEFYGNQWGPRPGNPYNLDTRRNIASVFGPASTAIWILLFPSLVEPPGDGIVFPLNAGRGMPLPMLINERAA